MSLSPTPVVVDGKEASSIASAAAALLFTLHCCLHHSVVLSAADHCVVRHSDAALLADVLSFTLALYRSTATSVIS